MDLTSLIFSKLSEDSDISSFVCSDSKDLEDFLRNDAKIRQQEKISTTYLVHSGTVLVGFFSLSMGCITSDSVKKMSLEIEDPPNKYPALLLNIRHYFWPGWQQKMGCAVRALDVKC